MANLVLNPPEVSSYQKAFIKDVDECRIYFSFPATVNINDIKEIHYSVASQEMNRSMIGTYNTTVVSKKNIKKDGEEYYIVIKDIDFEVNTFYKVQLRFSTIAQGGVSLAQYFYGKKNGVYYNDNFSSWSTVTLIKSISQPSLEFAGMLSELIDSKTISNNKLIVEGSLLFESNENDIERLEKYNLQLKLGTSLLEDSGELFSDNDKFYYDFAPVLENSEYTLIFNYTTSNGYSKTEKYTILYNQALLNSFGGELSLNGDNETGDMKVSIYFYSVTEEEREFYIYRTDVKSQFKKYELLQKVVLPPSAPNLYTIYDATVESGIWYKYGAVAKLGDNYSIMATSPAPAVVYLDDIFLLGDYKQLRVKYDPSVSSYSQKVAESTVETIGGIYPFVSRNNNLYYKTFSVSGTIHSSMDEYSVFIKGAYNDSVDPRVTLIEADGKVLGDAEGALGAPTDIMVESIEKKFWPDGVYTPTEEELIKEYNSAHPYHENAQDHDYERLFREKVLEFLYNGKPKLFRSPTEGNIILKLTNISLTPNQSLGRLVYSFSATGIEIDANTLANYNKYGLQKSNVSMIDMFAILAEDIVNGVLMFPANVEEITEENKLVVKLKAEQHFILKED